MCYSSIPAHRWGKCWWGDEVGRVKRQRKKTISLERLTLLIIIIYQASGGALVQYLTARKVASVTTQWSYDHLLQRSSAYEWSYSDHMRNQYIWYRWIYRVIRKVIFVYYIRLSYIWRTNVYMRVPFNILSVNIILQRNIFVKGYCQKVMVPSKW